MRIIKYSLAGILLICCAWFIGLLVWKVTDANEKLRVYLMSYVQPLINEKFNILKLEAGFGYFNLEKIYLFSGNERIQLTIDAIEIRYNLFQLALNKFDRGPTPCFSNSASPIIAPSATPKPLVQQPANTTRDWRR